MTSKWVQVGPGPKGDPGDPGLDITARQAAEAARVAAAAVAGDLRTHEAAPHNMDTTARASIATHVGSPHNTDTVARMAAAAAQAALQAHAADASIHGGGVPTTSGLNQAQVDTRVKVHTGQADPAGPFADDRISANIARAAAVATETARRVAGDKLTSVNIGNLAALVSALNAQATNDEQLEIEFTADVTHSGTTYQVGEIISIPPRSNAIERRFRLPQAASSDTHFPTIPEDGHDYALFGRDRVGSGAGNDPIRFWRRPNLVPNTPGTSSGIGRLLMVTGENDRDYAWRSPPAWQTAAQVAASIAAHAATPHGGGTGGGQTAQQVTTAINAAIATHAGMANVHHTPPTTAIDQTARNAAAAAAATANAANTRSNENTREVRTARDETAANKAIVDRMSVFETYAIEPAGIPGNDFPEFMALTLSTKLVDKTITLIRVSLSGVIVANLVQNLTPVPPATDLAAPFNNGVARISGGIVNLGLNAAARANLKNAVGTNTQFIEVGISYTFSDGTTAQDRGHFGTNNAAFRSATTDATARTAAAAAQATADAATTPAEATVIANTRAAAVAGPVIIITTIASYDATQNRFEDSSGDEVVVPNGSIVTLPQAVYNAAVTDADFIPNANAVFLTR